MTSLFSGVGGAAAGVAAGLGVGAFSSGSSGLKAFGFSCVSFAAAGASLLGMLAEGRLLGCAGFAAVEGTGNTLPICVPAGAEVLLLTAAGESMTGFWAL